MEVFIMENLTEMVFILDRSGSMAGLEKDTIGGFNSLLEKQKMEGVTRKLVGFEMVDRGIPRHGYELVNAEGEQVGVVTSGTMSPTRKIGIGMGYVKPEYSKVGTEICIDMRGRKLKAVVVKPPFRK